jgi:hypothetical protein
MRFRMPVLVALLAVQLFATNVSASAQQTQTSAAVAQQKLPAQLADSTFWRIITEFSEPEGAFNRFMVSNEAFYPNLISYLHTLNLKGGAYVGVAPEQNYHYIAALQPEIAFILDIRQEAIVQHLMFKAVFELSPTRADFISLLFTKPKPAGVSDAMNAFQTWNAFWYIPTDTTQFRANLARIHDHLAKTHKFPLSGYDVSLLNFVYESFYRGGPNLTSNGSGAPNDAGQNTFGNITSAVDASGIGRSFLATEAAYQYVRQMHLKNLVIPVVGDFTGPKALRSIGRYLTEHNTQLTAFYVSNVETYLQRANTTGLFYQNAATLPSTSSSVLIRGISPGSVCSFARVVASGFFAC